ncbi:unnamed protein product [Cuscuta epithymum]|uniref:Uncharacterized protein n=1 Tax=Cuscuta epithymum TaxID=186058 RepID=A0AAV0F7S3_9ASTE|nr:unnamed protein product [Cuscuta epithymum]
MFHNKLGRA